MNKEELKERTKVFAHRCVKLCIALPKNDLGNHIRKQLIKSSTSVAANYHATCVSQSKASFISKLGIVIEKADETLFWLEFIVEENLLKKRLVKPLLNEADELLSIFISYRKTAQKTK